MRKKDELLFETCPTCGSQDFTIRDRSPYGRELDILECNGQDCGRLWVRDELELEPKNINEYICPRCGADFYHESMIVFHFQIAHPEVKELIIEYE